MPHMLQRKEPPRFARTEPPERRLETPPAAPRRYIFDGDFSRPNPEGTGLNTTGSAHLQIVWSTHDNREILTYSSIVLRDEGLAFNRVCLKVAEAFERGRLKWVEQTGRIDGRPYAWIVEAVVSLKDRADPDGPRLYHIKYAHFGSKTRMLVCEDGNDIVSDFDYSHHWFRELFLPILLPRWRAARVQGLGRGHRDRGNDYRMG